MEAARAKQIIIDELRMYFLAHEDISCALVHGSFLREGRYNDIDVALLATEFRGSALQFELDLEASVSMKLALPREADIRLLNGAPAAFQYSVIKNGILLFARDEDAFAEFKESVLRRYLDFKHHRDLLLREALRS